MKTFTGHILAVSFAVAALASTVPAQAQYTSDIDIYSGMPSELDLPNVLVMLDNTANWKPVFAAEKNALKSAFTSLPVDKFRMGLMLFTESNDQNTGSYVRAAIRKLDTGYRNRMGGLIDSLTTQGSGSFPDQGSSPQVGLAMAEAWYYYAGEKPRSGAGAKKADYQGNTYGTTESKAIYALEGNAMASSAPAQYNNAFAVGNCAPNYIIYISNGYANSNDKNEATALLKKAYETLDPPQDMPGEIVVSPDGSRASKMDEWARFMKQSPQRVTTYTIDVITKKDGQTAGWSALLRSAAVSSGGEYYVVDATSGTDVGERIREALSKIFNQIQAVNSVFASASLPVSVNARGTYLNQVFMGMFRPDGDGHPRWRGNLKQFRFGYDPATDSLSLIDTQGNPAISGSTGFINPGATSYWSHASTFWTNEPSGNPASASDAPDGEVVEKGGIAQGVRETYATSQDARRIFTCVSCAANTNLATTAGAQFTSTNITPELLGVPAAERDALVAWVRGTDNAGDEQGPGGGVTVRPSVHGDVLHSRPAVVNYGGSTGVVVFYGSNDGLLRAVNGNQTGAGAGQELWAFVAQEHLTRLHRLRANGPAIRLSTTLMPATSTAADPLPRDYFADGPIGVYQKIGTGGVAEKVHIYSAMRRGGRLLYALDVSNPLQPRFLWKKSGTAPEGTSERLAVLGQTWSEPRVARLRGHANPVIIMGAGYDNVAEDVSPPGTTTMGNAVLVLDALDGTVLKQFATARSVAADVSLVDGDYDGYVDRAYAVDLGGNVYRVDFESGAETGKDHWGSFKVASLATDGSTRKFFYPPDVVLTRNYAALLLASGDREKPLATTGSDRFFTLYDYHTGKGTPEDPGAPIVATDLPRLGESSDALQPKGCYVPFAAGEKAINAPITAAGITYFSTNKPQPASTNACRSNLGEARVYSAQLFCRSVESEELIGGGLPPSPVFGVVTVTYTSQETGEEASKEVPFLIGAPNPKRSGIEGSKVTPTITPTRHRRYWYLENAR
jgi:type IV pilus assembly protein PilY1